MAPTTNRCTTAGGLASPRRCRADRGYPAPLQAPRPSRARLLLAGAGDGVTAAAAAGPPQTPNALVDSSCLFYRTFPQPQYIAATPRFPASPAVRTLHSSSLQYSVARALRPNPPLVMVSCYEQARGLNVDLGWLHFVDRVGDVKKRNSGGQPQK